MPIRGDFELQDLLLWPRENPIPGIVNSDPSPKNQKLEKPK